GTHPSGALSSRRWRAYPIRCCSTVARRVMLPPTSCSTTRCTVAGRRSDALLAVELGGGERRDLQVDFGGITVAQVPGRRETGPGEDPLQQAPALQLGCSRNN